MGQEQREAVKAVKVLKVGNGVIVALLPQLAWSYLSRVAARNPGNAKHSNLNRSMEREDRGRAE